VEGDWHIFKQEVYFVHRGENRESHSSIRVPYHHCQKKRGEQKYLGEGGRKKNRVQGRPKKKGRGIIFHKSSTKKEAIGGGGREGGRRDG